MLDDPSEDHLYMGKCPQSILPHLSVAAYGAGSLRGAQGIFLIFAVKIIAFVLGPCLQELAPVRNQ